MGTEAVPFGYRHCFPAWSSSEGKGLGGWFYQMGTTQVMGLLCHVRWKTLIQSSGRWWQWVTSRARDLPSRTRTLSNPAREVSVQLPTGPGTRPTTDLQRPRQAGTALRVEDAHDLG